jgi:hypothetical protein
LLDLHAEGLASKRSTQQSKNVYKQSGNLLDVFERPPVILLGILLTMLAREQISGILVMPHSIVRPSQFLSRDGG